MASILLLNFRCSNPFAKSLGIVHCAPTTIGITVTLIFTQLFKFYGKVDYYYQSFGDCTKSTNYNWYNRHFHVSKFSIP